MNATWDDEYLTVNEIAEHLKLNPQTVRNWIDQGALRAVRIGRRVRVSRAEMDRILAQGASTTAERKRRRSHLTNRTSSSAKLSSAPNDSSAGEAPSAAPNSPKAFRSSLTRWRPRSRRLTRRVQLANSTRGSGPRTIRP